MDFKKATMAIVAGAVGVAAAMLVAVHARIGSARG